MSNKTQQKNLQTLAVGQLQDLHGVLRNPISGRQVMVPLTSKAFVVGSLNPKKDSNGEEQVLIRDGQSTELREMPRPSACELLEEQKLKLKASTTKKRPLKSSLKPSAQKIVDGTKIASAVPAKNGTTSEGTNSSGVVEPRSYFEIKEEIDGSGRVVKSEAVDVTKHLELVAKHAGEANGEESKETVEDSKESIDIEEEGFDYQEIPVEEDNNRPPVSEQTYESLSARLEALARLEEEAEKKQREQQMSARELLSKGWTKGFLAGKTKSPDVQTIPKTKIVPNPIPESKAKDAPATEETPAKPKQSHGWSKGFFNKPSSKPATEATDSESPSGEMDGASSRKVSFQGSAPDVREIPRIGEKSATLLKKPPPPVANPNSRSASANPFDRSVVSDVVKERPTGKSNMSQQDSVQETEPNKKKLSKFALERQQAGSSSQQQNAPTKKKVSKFAQERQQIN